MSKKIRFSSDLIPLILSGKKTATWRLWDDKNLSQGDVLEFLETGTEKQFATAKIYAVIEKPLGQLTSKDKEGHEKYKSDKELYKTFSNYYQKPVGPGTLVKIVKYKLLP